jgi:uncharacterized membrane protein
VPEHVKVKPVPDEPPVSMGRAFRYTTIACEILIFALVGWIIGPYIFGPGGEIIGTFIGAIIGTLMMFCTLLYLAGMFGQQQKEISQPKAEER